MHGFGKGIEKTLRRPIVRRKIDDDFRSGRSGSGDLDVQNDFSVIARGVGRRVSRAIHGNWNDGRCGNAKTFEIGCDVLRPITAAEFDEADGLARAIDARREVIDPG